MAEPPIPIQEDMRFQRSTWKVERIGWIFLALIVVAALGGVFSHGYASKATAGTPPFSASYERFQRQTVLTHLRVTMPADADNEARLQIGKSLRDDYDIESIEPRPMRASADDDNLVFDFDAGNSKQLNVTLALRPHRAGLTGITLSSSDNHTLAFRAFVYP